MYIEGEVVNDALPCMHTMGFPRYRQSKCDLELEIL